MYVNLPQRSECDEFVFLAGANDQNVSGTSIEFPFFDGPVRPSFDHVNKFVVPMTVETRAASYLRDDNEHRNAKAARFRSDKFVRRPNKREVSLVDHFHTDWRDRTGVRMQNRQLTQLNCVKNRALQFSV